MAVNLFRFQRDQSRLLPFALLLASSHRQPETLGVLPVKLNQNLRGPVICSLECWQAGESRCRLKTLIPSKLALSFFCRLADFAPPSRLLLIIRYCTGRYGRNAYYFRPYTNASSCCKISI